MTVDHTDSIRCYLTVPFDCSYLADKKAVNQVIDPEMTLNDHLLGMLLNNGFRRSGGHVYRPHCETCRQCTAIRIPTSSFAANRSQRRNWQKNQHLRHIAAPPSFNENHYRLYLDYMNRRHPGSEMASAIPSDYIAFLTTPGITTLFHEFYQHDRLLAVAVTDHTPYGLSAVYTFFHPDAAGRGLGTYAILWQIQHAHQAGLPWVYLGYWIRDCAKMRYKTAFMPCEGFIDNDWRKMAAKSA